MIRPFAVLATAAALAACATDRVTLLDNDAGQPDGALAVLSARGEAVIDSPNTQASLGSGRTRTRPIDPNKPEFNALLAQLPPPVARFSILFPSDEFRIPENQRGVLDSIRAELASRPGAQIEVAGFTDSDQSEDYNLELSKQRADAVAQQLRSFGFEVDPADAVARGEYDARARLGDGVVSEDYRRVDVIIR